MHVDKCYFNDPVHRHNFSRTYFAGDIFVLLVSVFSFVRVNIVGEVFISELALVIAVPLLIQRAGGFFVTKTLKIILALLVCWLVSQALSDAVNGIELKDRLRGLARIIFFTFSIFALFVLVNTPKRVFLMLSGFAFSKIINPFLLFDNFDFEIFWKFGVGSGLLSFVVLLPVYLVLRYGKMKWPIKMVFICLLIFSGLSFFLNSRSFAGILLINSVVLLVYFFLLKGRLITQKAMVVFLVAGLILGGGVLKLYGYGASTGFFGQPALDKYNMQVIYGDDPVSLLLAGRSELLVSRIAVADKPILGHGSWAKNFKYILLYHQIKEDFSDDTINPISEDEVGLIPSHSYLLGSWVESGIVGAIFWVYIIYLIIFKAFPAAVFNASPLSLVFIISFVSMLWSIFFSPFGSTARLVFAFNVVLILLVIRERGNHP